MDRMRGGEDEAAVGTTIGRYSSRSDRKVEPGQIIETRFQLKC